MHDIKSIRDNPAAFDEGMKKRGLTPQSPEILKLDEEKRNQQTEIQELQSKRNQFAKAVGMAKAKGEDATSIMEESKAVNDRIATLEAAVNEEGALAKILSSLPNVPADDVPLGKDETGNKEIRIYGTKRDIKNPKEHFELGEKLGLMDFERASKISGARFVVLKGPLARLERALAGFFLDIHTKEFGYTEVVPPLLVKDNAAFGTAQLPKFGEDLFSTKNVPYDIYFKEMISAQLRLGISIADARDPENQRRIEAEAQPKINAAGRLWLVPTAEVPLTNLVNDEILDEAKLPIRYTAYTPCFRSEAGSAGKDTRGMIRQHQFSKVEMVSITHPDQSNDEHERMTNCAEEILKRLGLHYRVMLLCTGDMGFASRKTYDIEVWLPGQNAYREISSCSNCGDFQARRMKARFKPQGGKGTQFVHTLNGSGLPIGRTMVAILENYQQEDGSITIPEALRPYMDNASVIR